MVIIIATSNNLVKFKFKIIFNSLRLNLFLTNIFIILSINIIISNLKN